jgi:hypothetical protein
MNPTTWKRARQAQVPSLRRSAQWDGAAVFAALAVILVLPSLTGALGSSATLQHSKPDAAALGGSKADAITNGPPQLHFILNATGNLTAVLSRTVLLVGLAAGALVTLVWSRVAVSWFSHDPSRKVQAKERARDAAIGSLVLVAAVSGLAWGLTRFVLTGS